MTIIIQIIQKSLKALFMVFTNHKKKWLLFFLLSIVFLLIRFPYESAMLYLISQIQEQTKSAFQLKYESFYINPINPSLVFNKPKIIIKKNQNTLKAEQLKISPSYSSLVRGKVGGVANLKWANSILNITFRKKSTQEDKTGWLINIKSKDLDPSLLSAFASWLSNTKGKINLDMELFLDPLFKAQPQGFWHLTGQGFESQALSYTFPGDMGAISFPHFNWSQLKAEGQIKNGNISLNDVSFGTKTDSLQVQTRGVVSLTFSKQTYSKRIISRLKNYNIGVKILVKEDLEPKLRFLDWFLKQTKSKTPHGYLYMAHIKGNSMNIPNVLAVDKLPTLNEIKKPYKPTN